MQFPLISEYLAAICDAHDNLDKLSIWCQCWINTASRIVVAAPLPLCSR